LKKGELAFGQLGLWGQKNPIAQFRYGIEAGYQETEILRQLTTREQLKPLAVNQVLVWHTRTERSDLISEEKLALNGDQKLIPLNSRSTDFSI
jgi:hypothetical protein